MYSVLESTIIDMLSNYPFYGNLITLMDKKLSESVPIAAVSITTRVTLLINPKVFNTLSKEVRTGILLHECYHIIHNHIARGKNLATSFNKALNIAADRSINEHIHILTKNNKIVATIPDELTVNINGTDTAMKPVTKKNFKDMYKDKVVLDGQTMEYYYKFLKDNAEEGDGEGDFSGDLDTIDDHSSWENSKVSKEQAEHITKRILNKAVEKTPAGSIPGDVKAELDKLNNSVVSWNHILQRFVAKCIDTNIDSSRKRRSRRFGIIHPGTIKEPKLRLGIAVDTSGSVSDNYLSQFLSEIKKIYNLGIEIYIVQADTIVQDAVEYNPKKPLDIKGRGGTAFQPAIDALQKVTCDAIIYFTDGENYSEDLTIKKPILWALCPSYTIPKGAKEKDTIKITLKEDSDV